MIGTRVYNQEELRIDGAYYYSEETKSWWCRTPTGDMGNLGAHDVIEHEDGTITVSPSILVSTRVNGKDIELYHGYLTKGVWT